MEKFTDDYQTSPSLFNIILQVSGKQRLTGRWNALKIITNYKVELYSGTNRYIEYNIDLYSLVVGTGERGPG